MRRKHARLTQFVYRQMFQNGCGWASLILAFSLWMPAFAATAQENHTPVVRFDTRRIVVAGIDIQVEVAMTRQQRQQGLMYREYLPANEGMLFIYPSPRILRFWMRNTRIPLDIAFIDRQGIIRSIQPMPRTESDDRTVSPSPAMYALEMNLGWFRENDVCVGDRVSF